MVNSNISPPLQPQPIKQDVTLQATNPQSSHKAVFIVLGLMFLVIIILSFFGFQLYGKNFLTQVSKTNPNPTEIPVSNSPADTEPATTNNKNIVSFPIPPQPPSENFEGVGILYVLRGEITAAEIRGEDLYLGLNIPLQGAPKSLVFNHVDANLWKIEGGKPQQAKPEDFKAGQKVRLGASFNIKSNAYAENEWKGAWVSILGQ